MPVVRVEQAFARPVVRVCRFIPKIPGAFLCQNSPQNQRRESDAKDINGGSVVRVCLVFLGKARASIQTFEVGRHLQPIWKVQSFWSRIRLFNAMVVSFKIAVLQGLGLLYMWDSR